MRCTYRATISMLALKVGLMVPCLIARAEQYPSKTVRFVVPQAAGEYHRCSSPVPWGSA